MLLETKRIIIRPLIHDDLETLLEINNDPKCIEFNGWKAMSEEDCLSTLYKWTFEYQRSKDYGVFMAIDKVNKDPIGICFLKKVKNTYEIGFRFRTSKWGRGYAGEVAEALSEHAEVTLKADSVFAETHANNKKSRRVFEKLKFEEKPHPEEGGILYERRFK